jgi:hypothetical protein
VNCVIRRGSCLCSFSRVSRFRLQEFVAIGHVCNVLRIAHSLTARVAALAQNLRAVNATKSLFLTALAAAIALANPAHGQIAFRSASSASVAGGGGGPVTPTLRAAVHGGLPMTIVGTARTPATDGAVSTATSASIIPPAGMEVGDMVLVFASARVATSVAITVSQTGGQGWTSNAGTGGGANPKLASFRAIFNGTWSANPAWSWGTTAATYQIWMVVVRGADASTLQFSIDGNQGTTPEDWKSGTFVAPASPFDVTIPAGTWSTSTDNAMVFAAWTSADDNTWALQTPEWTNPAGQAQWRTMAAAGSAGADSSLSVAYLTQATAGPLPAFTNQQTALGGDPGVWRIFAIRPAGIRKPPGTVAGDVMIASIVWGNNAFTATPPAGWTLVRRVQNTSGTGWSLAIYRRNEYASVDIPMLPVTHGVEFTRLHILLYTIVLFVVSLLPYLMYMSGPLYLAGALLLGGGFLYYAIRMQIDHSDRLAMRTFSYSIVYLMALFAVLLFDHYMPLARALF